MGLAEFMDARGNLVVGSALVCLVGVGNLAVGSIGDAVLVYDRRAGNAVRDLTSSDR